MASAEIPAESAPNPAVSIKTDALFNMGDAQEDHAIFQSASADETVDDDDDDDNEDWREVLPDPSAETGNDDDDNEDWREVLPPPAESQRLVETDKKNETVPFKPVPETPATVSTTTTGGMTVATQSKARNEPDFSRYKTNVARRLWEAQELAEKAGIKSSSDMVPLTREFQQYRKKMSTLVRYIDEYHDAMQAVKAKRNQLFDYYAMMVKGTPIWEHIGMPLTPEQVTEIQNGDDEVTPESIEKQSKSIMKVADEIGTGSLVAFQQLAAMQDKLDELDFQTHIRDYMGEWDDVVTTMGDKEFKAVLELSKRRHHYVHKVEKLRNKVNSIEHRGVRDAPIGLTQKLDRNEDKLEKADDMYQDKSNDLAVVLREAVRKGWIDMYPLIKNAMKFEVNRVSRESSSYGRLTGTLAALKSDYKEATRGADLALEG